MTNYVWRTDGRHIFRDFIIHYSHRIIHDLQKKTMPNPIILTYIYPTDVIMTPTKSNKLVIYANPFLQVAIWEEKE